MNTIKSKVPSTTERKRALFIMPYALVASHVVGPTILAFTISTASAADMSLGTVTRQYGPDRNRDYSDQMALALPLKPELRQAGVYEP